MSVGKYEHNNTQMSIIQKFQWEKGEITEPFRASSLCISGQICLPCKCVISFLRLEARRKEHSAPTIRSFISYLQSFINDEERKKSKIYIYIYRLGLPVTSQGIGPQSSGDAYSYKS